MTPIDIHPDQPVLIAGPTAAGKSALALFIAQNQGGIVVNADALQVFDGWRILTARPSAKDEALAPHALYGHVPFDADYSVGHWLRDVMPFLSGKRPIIVGGTGLNFAALTEGLADIPPTPAEVRVQADALELATLLAEVDPQTAARIDQKNRVRVQRAWEVQQATGTSLAQWQDTTPPPLLPLSRAVPIVLDAPKEWLSPRIEQRFDMMLNEGAVQEAQEMESLWNPAHSSSKAIGAPELIAAIRNEMTLEKARELSIIASRQYAKRQRTWFNKRMRDWHKISLPMDDLSKSITFFP